MPRYKATIEFVSSTRAIIELTDDCGEWSGAQRIDVRQGGRDALYEAGYIYASASAACKGGILEAYSKIATNNPEHSS